MKKSCWNNFLQPAFIHPLRVGAANGLMAVSNILLLLSPSAEDTNSAKTAKKDTASKKQCPI
ncbi:MAG: hypothetical protein MJB12_17030 [Firmicutes bacterium]|nr:hypothetical protein [Bacillota bacterium]